MRQSELGEFDPEFPSSLGPVTEYHGTIDMQNVLDQGIRGGSPARRSRRYVPESLRGEDRISYTTDDPDLALQFAQERAKKFGLPASNVGVVGIRGGGLPNAVPHQEPDGGVFAGTQSNVRAGGIPRSSIVPVVKSEKKKKKPAFALIISVGPKMPKKPEDTADPEKEVKKSDAYVQVSASCDCCSPSTQAFGTLVEDYFEKGKKKSKPFHGYNPKRHHKKGGLNAAGRAKFKRETGANLKPPVTTKPSKLKPGSKRAKRRKSFCARMSGSKGPTSKDGKLTPKGAALKRWNC